MCKHELPTSSRRSFQKYHLRDIHTERQDQNYIPCYFTIGQLLQLWQADGTFGLLTVYVSLFQEPGSKFTNDLRTILRQFSDL